MATRNNTVPSGQAGTGAAFLLGGSKALDNWIAQDTRNAQVRSANAQAQKDYNQQISKSYNANRMKTPVGQAYQAEIMGDVEKLNEVGAKYLAQGFDIYNPNFRDPAQVQAHNQFLQDKAFLETKIEARKRYEDAAKVDNAAYDKDPYGFDNTPDVYNEFEKNNTLGDIVNKGVKFPSLQRTFDYNKNVTEQIPVLKTENERLDGNERIVETVANVPAITSFADKLLTSGQARNWVEKQIGGSVDGLLKTTKKEDIRKALDSEFRSPTGIELMAELVNKGKVPSFGSPQYDKFLNDAVNEQLKAEEKYDKILSGAVQDGIAKANPSYKRVPDFSLARERRSIEDQAMQREQLALSRAASRRAEANQSNRGQDETIIYRKQLVDDMLNGVAGSGETIKGIVEAKPEYTDKLKINVDGDKISFVIPDKVTMKVVDGKPKSQAVSGRTVTVDRKDSNAKSKMNQLINEITGENIPESKFQSGNAGGKVKTTKSTAQPKTKTATVSQVKSLIGKKGYEGYTEKELIDYYKSQGYTIK